MSDDITINLAEALNASACVTGTLLQVEAKKQLDLLLEKFETQSENVKQKNHSHNEWDLEFNPPRYNNTIFISGQRGAGKTTFLRSVLLEQAKPNNKMKIQPIAFIDPTLIEVHEHILVQIIAKIQANVTTALSRTSDESKRHKFQTCMEEMAEGLKLLGNGANSKAQDPAFFLNKALKHAVGGQNLECKLNELIEKATQILNVNLLIIAFDDVDTNTKEAFNVLELIRKYLTSPKLVVLISGDPSLYSHIVQGQRAKELNNGNSTIKGMDELSKNLPEMISHLEQQYLAKVLPVEHRIELKNLANLVEQDSKIFVVLKNKVEIVQGSINFEKKETNLIEIKEYIELIVSECLKINKKEIESYVNFFLEQPIRTIFQILKSIDESTEATKINSQSLFTALRDSYIGDLRKENIPTEKLSNHSIHPHTIGMALFNLCKNNGELETGFYARSDGNSSSYNSSMFVLSSVISNHLNSNEGSFNQSAGRFLQLMLAGPAASTIFMNNVTGKIERPESFRLELSNTQYLKSEAEQNAQNYIDYIGLNKSQDSFSLTAHYSPLIAERAKDVELGVLKVPRGLTNIYQQGLMEKINSVFGSDIIESENNIALANIETLASKIDVIEEILHVNKSLEESSYKKSLMLSGKAITLASHSVLETTGKSDYVSIHCLLASLSTLLLCKKDDIGLAVNKLSGMPTFGFPDFIKSKNVNPAVSNNTEDLDDTQNGALSGVKSNIDCYIKSWREDNDASHNAISSLLLGKIWTRFNYSIANTSSKMNTKDQLLSVAIEKFIWVILNSFLIEEARYTFSANQSIIDALSNAKNVASASTVLISNLSSVIDAIKKENEKEDEVKLKEKLPLTYLMATCPLFFPFLATGSSKTDDREKLFAQIKLFIELGNINKELPAYLGGIDGFTSQAMGLISRFPIMGQFSNAEEVRKIKEAEENKKLLSQIRRKKTTLKSLDKQIADKEKVASLAKIELTEGSAGKQKEESLEIGTATTEKQGTDE